MKDFFVQFECFVFVLKVSNGYRRISFLCGRNVFNTGNSLDFKFKLRMSRGCGGSEVNESQLNANYLGNC